MEVCQYLIPTVKHSPSTIYPNFSRIVNDRGVIEYGFDDNGAYVDDSYGTLRTSIMYIHGSLV